MKRSPLRRRAPLRANKSLKRKTPLRRTRSLAASDAQRAAVAGRRCIVCATDRRIDPAHLIPRKLGGCDHALCVAPLCRVHHRAYDGDQLDLLPHLEPGWREQLAHAVAHVGLIGALRQITGKRTAALAATGPLTEGEGRPRAGTLDGVPTLVRDPPPAEFDALLRRRRQLGQDLHDEIWEGVLHMNPAPSRRHAKVEGQLYVLLGPLAAAAGLVMLGEFNLGQPDDYRVPDGALDHDTDESNESVFASSAALVFEVVSPGDESWENLPFYAAHAVSEVLIVDPQQRTVSWLGLDGETYRPLERSALIELGPAELAERIDWP
jgi:Uma2 family endonuclease